MLYVEISMEIKLLGSWVFLEQALCDTPYIHTHTNLFPLGLLQLQPESQGRSVNTSNSPTE